jgi:hypothetical protein
MLRLASRRNSRLWLGSSPSDCRNTVDAPCGAGAAMLAATTMSGLPAPVPNTPSAASLFAAESLLCAGPGAPGLAAHPPSTQSGWA